MRILSCLAMVLLFLGAALPGLAVDVPQMLHDNYKAGKPIPLPSQHIKGLDQTKAYQVQAAYVGKMAAGDKVAGYQAGLTSAPAQKKFKAPGPARGVLLESMVLPGPVVEVDLFTRAMLEVEIGYLMAQDVTQPVSAASVKGYIAKVLPVVEVPDLAFATFKGLTFEDIVAANVGARAVLMGKPVELKGVDVNAVTGKLVKDGKDLGPPVSGRAAMGDQYKALAWTINNVLAGGGQVKKGMLVITGSLGRMYPGKLGNYQAIYTGGLGSLSFSIK